MQPSNNPEGAQAKSLIVNYLVIILLLSLLWLLYEGVSCAFFSHSATDDRSERQLASVTVPDRPPDSTADTYLFTSKELAFFTAIIYSLIVCHDMTGVLNRDLSYHHATFSPESHVFAQSS